MSPINFDALAKERPDLQKALRQIAEWLSQHSETTLIPSSLARQLRGIDPYELASALVLLTQHGVLDRRYKVITPSGAYADGDFGDIADIPDRMRDRFNNSFDTEEADVFPVFLRRGLNDPS